MKRFSYLLLIILTGFVAGCRPGNEKDVEGYFSMTKEQFQDKIKGAWAVQTIGVTYGGPTEFKYKKRMI